MRYSKRDLMGSIRDSVKGMSLGELVSRLHSTIKQFIGDLDIMVAKNSEVSNDEIHELRARITERLREGKDTVENERLLKLLNLLLTDKTVIELMREDTDEWMDFLEAISKHIDSGAYKATENEKRELSEMKELTMQITALIRK